MVKHLKISLKLRKPSNYNPNAREFQPRKQTDTKEQP